MEPTIRDSAPTVKSRNVNDLKCNVSTLQLLPYYSITNIELYNTLETAETYIKSCLENRNFSHYIHSSQPDVSKEIPCKYYSTEELCNLCNKQQQLDLKLLHHNIRSLDLHFGEMLSLMQTCDNKIDVIALSEIGKKNIESRGAMLKHYGYEMKFVLPNLAKGGVALIYKDNLHVTERADLKIKANDGIHSKIEVEDLWIELSLMINKKREDYVIGVIYRHPGGSVENLDTFSNKIKDIMIKINLENKKCIMLGDINIDGLKINTNDHVEHFFQTIMEQDFVPTITLPTRVVDTSVSLIDHIIVNRNVLRNNIFTGNLYCGITDHMPNLIVVKSQVMVKSNERRYVRLFGDANMCTFRNYIQNVSWDQYYEAKDPNKSLEIFYKIYNDAFNNSFPLKRLSRNRAKDKKWITTNLRNCIKYRDNLYKKYLSRPTPENKEIHALYRNMLTSCLREAEDNYYKELIKNENKTLFKLWNIFGSVINPTKMKKHNNISSNFYSSLEERV